ncbi:MAG TPA: DUF3617 domain-containing protein [Allosphingosinicella sp.]|nr:DUF3617 domain-containing protein [Allosphingosinicella sp.]
MKAQWVLTGLLALAACGSGEGNGNGSAGAGGNGAAAKGDDGREMAATLQPGAYEVTTEFLGIEGQNVPPAMAEAMKGQKETKRNCLTEKDLKDAQGGMFTGQDPKECSENSIRITGGRMQGRLTCGTGAEQSTMEVDGRYSAQSYEADMRMSAGGATTRVKMSARRVGECSADDAQEG